MVSAFKWGLIEFQVVTPFPSPRTYCFGIKPNYTVCMREKASSSPDDLDIMCKCSLGDSGVELQGFSLCAAESRLWGVQCMPLFSLPLSMQLLCCWQDPHKTCVRLLGCSAANSHVPVVHSPEQMWDPGKDGFLSLHHVHKTTLIFWFCSVRV